MRVVFNRTATWEAKTGVGHHAAQLLRALRRHASDVRIDCYPTPWLWLARRAWSHFRPPDKRLIDVRQHDAPRKSDEAPPKEMPMSGLRRWARGLLDRHRETTFFDRRSD